MIIERTVFHKPIIGDGSTVQQYKSFAVYVAVSYGRGSRFVENDVEVLPSDKIFEVSEKAFPRGSNFDESWTITDVKGNNYKIQFIAPKYPVNSPGNKLMVHTERVTPK